MDHLLQLNLWIDLTNEKNYLGANSKLHNNLNKNTQQKLKSISKYKLYFHLILINTMYLKYKHKITKMYLLSTVIVSLVITVVEFDVFTVVVVVDDNSCLVTVF